MYIDFHGYEIEDLEGDNMRQDAAEDIKMAKEHDLASILYLGEVAQAEDNGLVYTVRDNYDPHTGALWLTLYIAKGAEPPYQTTDFEYPDDITNAYPGLKWEAVEMEV